MKKILLLSFIVSPISMQCMESNVSPSSFQHAPLEAYPESIGYLPIEEVFTKVPTIPTDVKEEVTQFLTNYPVIKMWLSLPNSAQHLTEINTIRNAEAQAMGNMSQNNVTLFTKRQTAVLKIANMVSRLRNNLSSLGYDPYQQPGLLAVEAALTFAGPSIQHTSIPIGQYVLGQSGSSVIEELPTWFYHVPGQPTELDDKNYIAVQQAIPSSFCQFSRLPSETKQEFIHELDLAELYKALKYMHYAFPSEDNLWVNSEIYKVMLPDTESPNNEGVGPKRKFGKAILGQSLSKAKHNIRNPWDGGHRMFADIVKRYGSQSDIEEWTALYESDDTVK